MGEMKTGIPTDRSPKPPVIVGPPEHPGKEKAIREWMKEQNFQDMAKKLGKNLKNQLPTSGEAFKSPFKTKEGPISDFPFPDRNTIRMDFNADDLTFSHSQ